MPQINNIAITDGIVPITLTPDSNGSDGFKCSSETGSVKAANLDALMSGRPGNTSSSQFVRLRVPVVRTDVNTGVDYVAGYNIFSVTCRMDHSATSAEHVAAFGYLVDLLGDTAVHDFVTNQKAFF